MRNLCVPRGKIGNAPEEAVRGSSARVTNLAFQPCKRKQLTVLASLSPNESARSPRIGIDQQAIQGREKEGLAYLAQNYSEGKSTCECLRDKELLDLIPDSQCCMFL